MATEKQVAANRSNAQRSTGPRTTDGKDRIRLNALKHGLRVEAFDVLPNEDAGVFAARMEAWNRDCQPTTEKEAELVRQVVCLIWKLDRAARYEHALRSKKMQDIMYECGLNGEDPALVSVLASHDPTAEGERLRRYQTSLQRDVLRTMAAFSKLKKESAGWEASTHEGGFAITPDPLGPDQTIPSASVQSAIDPPNEPGSDTPGDPGTVSSIGPRRDDLFVTTDHVTIKANSLHSLGMIHRITGGRNVMPRVENPPKGVNLTPIDRISCERR